MSSNSSMNDPVSGREPSVALSDVGIRMWLNRDKSNTLKTMFLNIPNRNKKKPEEFWPLRHISFSVYPGDRLAVLGLNGSGKSTLLKIISNVYVPAEGSVRARGVLAPLIELGAGFCSEYTAIENIFLYGTILGYRREYLAERAGEIIEFAELQDFTDVPVKKYSSGMRSRLGFSICTAVNPDILLLDEVLSVGDAHFRIKSEKRLMDMMNAHTTVLFVSHSLEQAKRICNKAIILDKGRMAGYGDIEEIAGLYEEMVR